MISEKKSGALSFICTFIACLMSVPIIQSNYKNINSVFMGLKAFKTIKYFIITGTNNKIGFQLRWVFGGFYWRVFRWVHPKKPGGFFGVCTRVSEPWIFQQLFCLNMSSSTLLNLTQSNLLSSPAREHSALQCQLALYGIQYN